MCASISKVLVQIMLCTLVLSACGGKPSGPPTEKEATAAAFLFLLNEYKKENFVPLAACVDMPPGVVDDVIAANQGLLPISDCLSDGLHYYPRSGRQSIPVVRCALARENATTPDVTPVECDFIRGPLDGTGIGFDVTRTENGLQVVKNGHDPRM